MRDEFLAKSIDTLAKRAGMQCSNPECRQPTSGPTELPDKSVNIGVAAHISAAAPGGPRYDDTKSSEARSSIENGIWLCQKCAKLVDSDTTRYSDQLLKKWKMEAEAEAAKALETGRRPALSPINAAVVIQGEGAIQISGPNAVNIAPGGISINGPIIQNSCDPN